MAKVNGFWQTSLSRLEQAGACSRPAKGFQTPFADAQAAGVGEMTRGAVIAGRTPPFVVLRHLWGDAEFTPSAPMVLRVKAFVASDGEAPSIAGLLFEQML